MLLHRHVDELVLSLGLHHAGSLLPDPLDGLWDVDVTVQTLITEPEIELIRSGGLGSAVGQTPPTLAADNVNEDVDDNDGTGSADACTAMT